YLRRSKLLATGTRSYPWKCDRDPGGPRRSRFGSPNRVRRVSTADLAEEFQRHRPYLRAVAYRMLGSTTEAEDALQEAWLRLDRRPPDDISDLRPWLSTVGLAAGSRRRSQSPTPTSRSSVGSSTPSLPRLAAATSRRCCRCSTRMSCSGRTAAAADRLPDRR